MKTFNKVLSVLIEAIVLYLSVKDNNYTYLLFTIVLVIPFIIKLPNITATVYLLYSFLGIFLGFQCHLYQKVGWYDDFVHFLFGIVSGIIGLYLLHLFKVDKKAFFNVFFLIMLTLAISAVWEIIEYTCDTLFHSNMQRLGTGVTDTMKDIINALLGNILFVIAYIYELKCPLIINKLTKEIKEYNLCKKKLKNY